ncbi:MAG TPA: glycosyltransferase family 2 protein, partial [Abditibacteriaceae bacterium]|nr:glycosyltransferase family 2 protein [Abditibacteriaceae bacterium]
MSDQNPLISVIIVSYNTRQMTLECLRTLYASLDNRVTETWVVDNASSDGTPAAIGAEFPQVRLIENRHNVGFGAANNQAMARARGEYFLLLNSDAFPLPGAIGALVEYLQKHPRVAAVGPRLLNRDG